MKPILAVDLDDVLGDYVGPFIEFARTKGLELQPGLITGSLEQMGLHPKTYFDTFETEGYLAKLPVIPGSQAAIKALADQFDIRVVTSRPPERMATTSEWVYTHFPEIRAVAFSRTKGELCRLWGAWGLVDDQIHYAEQFEKSFVLSQIWNTSWNGPRGTWAELVTMILRASEGLR